MVLEVQAAIPFHSHPWGMDPGFTLEAAEQLTQIMQEPGRRGKQEVPRGAEEGPGGPTSHVLSFPLGLCGCFFAESKHSHMTFFPEGQSVVSGL